MSGPKARPQELSVRIERQREGEPELVIVYEGTEAQVLQAAGYQDKLLAPGRRGITRRDADGHRAFLVHLSGRVRLTLHKPQEAAMALPGVRDWLLDEWGSLCVQSATLH